MNGTVVENIRAGLVVPGNNDRKEFDREGLQELANSIDQNGLAQPITVRPIVFFPGGYRFCPVGPLKDWKEAWRSVMKDAPLSEGESRDLGNGYSVVILPWSDHIPGTQSHVYFQHETGIGVPFDVGYEIVAGERRFRAMSTVLEWETVPALVKLKTDEEASRIMLAENVGRADLNPVEEAKAYYARQQEYDWTIKQIAEFAGTSVQTVRARMSLLELSDQVQDMVATGNIPLGHAEEMSRLNPDQQAQALKLLATNGRVTLDMFKRFCQELLDADVGQGALFDITGYWVKQAEDQARLEESLRQRQEIPTSEKLPEVKFDPKDTAGDVIWRYIQDLQEAGYATEAIAIGTLFDALLKARKVKNFRA